MSVPDSTPPSPTAPEAFDAIVVGGGFAGVRAARDLGDAGRSVLLIEARDRLGGRVWTRPFAGRETPIEAGGTWISTDVHPFTAEEVERYGFALRVSHAGEVSTRWSLGGELVHGFPLERGELYELERALFEVIRASHRIDVDVPRDEQDLADLDISVADFVDALDPGIRVREFLYMWAGLGSGALPSEWSMLTALSLIAAMDNSVYGWYGAVTDAFEHGISQVVETVAADSGARIELSTPVARIEQDGDRVVVSAEDGRSWSAPTAVVAVPIALWPEIEFAPALPADKLEPARRGHPGRMKKTWMIVEGIPDNLYASGWGTEFVQMFPEGADRDGLVTLGMCAPPSDLDPHDLEAVTRAVRQLAPEGRVLATDLEDWATDPFARGTWYVPPPGVLSGYHSALGRAEGRLSFAGADVAVRWIGWIDGALETGARAAREAIARLAG
ncbi:MAG: FAD-dependent oxidoreductase [Actinobacteria bacterium]|nr:FAD-dependent oxidoreductase [Actinomycetota bacterium]